MHTLHLASIVRLILALARAGGMIINTCGWVDGDGYTMQLNTIEIFNPDYIFVIAHERLYSDLQTYLRTTNKTNIQLVKLPKSGGVRNLR